MSQDVAPPPPAADQKKKKRPRLAPWLSDKPETRSIQIGVLGTILIHLLLLLFAPQILEFSHHKASAPPRHVNKTFNITLAPQPKPRPAPKPAMRYVEANPNAPENVPDKTNNVSDRNQQVAQMNPVKSHSDMPTLQGRKDIPVQQIVTGNLEKPQENVPTPPPTPPKTAVAQAPRRERNPLAGIDRAASTSGDGFASNIGKQPDNQEMIPQRIDGMKQGPQVSNFSAGIPQIDPKHPQPRRVMELHVRPAVFAENKFGTSNMGVTALDARWSNYGVYMKRLIETVQIEWDRILDESAIYQTSGNFVSVTFILNSKGEIAKVISVTPTPGTSDSATRACEAGITNRSPYGPWTADMISVLGNEQQLTFTFYYQ